MVWIEYYWSRWNVVSTGWHYNSNNTQSISKVKNTCIWRISETVSQLFQNFENPKTIMDICRVAKDNNLYINV